MIGARVVRPETTVAESEQLRRRWFLERRGGYADGTILPLLMFLGHSAMRFLLRMTFWLGIFLILLSNVGSQPVPKSQISTSDVLVAARDVVTDITHLCERQPQACPVGSQTTVMLVERAQAGAKILYEFLGHQFGSDDSGSVRTEGVAIQPASQQTLLPADLLPPWHGPQPIDTPRDKQRTPARSSPSSLPVDAEITEAWS